MLLQKMMAEQHLKLYSSFYIVSIAALQEALRVLPNLLRASCVQVSWEPWSCGHPHVDGSDPVTRTRSYVFWRKKWQHRPVTVAMVAMHPLTAQTPRCHESTAWHDTWKFDLKLVSGFCMCEREWEMQNRTKKDFQYGEWCCFKFDADVFFFAQSLTKRTVPIWHNYS